MARHVRYNIVWSKSLVNHIKVGFYILFFFFNDPATTQIYTLSLHDALPISDDADHESVQHEDARHGLAGRAHRLQDGDLPVLLDDDHGERADDVEGGDDHDQHQQDEHHELLQLERREQVFVELHPVARPVGAADRVLDRLGDAVRREDVRDLHLDAGHRVAHVEELLRLLDRHVDQRRIVLVHPG